MTASVTRDGDVSVVTFDDGKANALSFDAIAALSKVVADESAASKAIVLAGRPGVFCAGLDLKVVRSGDPQQMTELLDRGTDLFEVMLAAPVPIVAACTGHALAGGALLMLCCDYRIGLRGDFRIGFTEVAIGLPLPTFGAAVARVRLDRRHFIRAVVLAETTGPDEAVGIGFLDETVEADVMSRAVEKAEALAALAGPAYAAGKAIAYGTIPRD